MAKCWMIKEILVLFWLRTCTVQECRKGLWMPPHAVDARAGGNWLYWHRVVCWLTNSVLKVFTPTVLYRELSTEVPLPHLVRPTRMRHSRSRPYLRLDLAAATSGSPSP